MQAVGTHDELLASSPLYRRLAARQFDLEPAAEAAHDPAMD
jgi:hypothetical protein